MTKPRITKHGMLWQCRAPFRPGLGLGLTPLDAYRNWMLDSQRPMLSPQPLPRLPIRQPADPWPIYQPPVFAPAPPADPWWKPPYTVTCWQ